jgi:hypothetical protein
MAMWEVPASMTLRLSSSTGLCWDWCSPGCVTQEQAETHIHNWFNCSAPHRPFGFDVVPDGAARWSLKAT